MIKQLFLFFVMTLCALGAHSQEGAQDFSWRDGAPEMYVAANTQLIISATSACNTGGEAFKDFISRFRKDISFRNQRLKFGEMDYYFNNFEDFRLIKGFTERIKCLDVYGTWYNVSTDTVCFKYEDTPLCDEEWSGNTFFFRFQRIDGKWYCTGTWVSGWG